MGQDYQIYPRECKTIGQLLVASMLLRLIKLLQLILALFEFLIDSTIDGTNQLIQNFFPYKFWLIFKCFFFAFFFTTVTALRSITFPSSPSLNFHSCCQSLCRRRHHHQQQQAAICRSIDQSVEPFCNHVWRIVLFFANGGNAAAAILYQAT